MHPILANFRRLGMRAAHSMESLLAGLVFLVLFLLVIGSASVLYRLFRLVSKKERVPQGNWQKKPSVEPTLENLEHPY